MIKVCITIFFARILDVAIGTIKTFEISRNKRFISSILAFFEVFIWFYVARRALNIEMNSIFVPISYSLGFAFGTYLGSIISSFLIKDDVIVELYGNEKCLKEIIYKKIDIKKDNIFFIKTKEKNIKKIVKLLDNDSYIISFFKI